MRLPVLSGHWDITSRGELMKRSVNCDISGWRLMLMINDQRHGLMPSGIEQSCGANAYNGVTVKPDLRLVIIYYLIPVLSAGTALLAYVLPINDSIQFVVGIGSVVAIIGYLY